MGPRARLIRFLAVNAIASSCITSCATRAPVSELAAFPSPVTAEAPPDTVPVVRHSRYTLIELVPEPTQRDLLLQVVEVSIPPTLDATVGDALRHVLLRSGYRLCDAADAAPLYALPLPAAHMHLGPLMLRDALLTLAGPTWELVVDDANRVVCFHRPAHRIAIPNAAEART